MFQKCIW